MVSIFFYLFIVYQDIYVTLHARTYCVRAAAAWPATLTGPCIRPCLGRLLHGTHMRSIYLYVYIQSTHIHTLLCTGWCELLRRGLLRSQAHASDPVLGSMARICYMSIYISMHRRLIYREHARTHAEGADPRVLGVSPGRLTRGPVPRNKPHPRPWSVPSCGGAGVRPKRGYTHIDTVLCT